MRILFVFSFCLLFAVAKAQPTLPLDENGEVVFSEVVEVNGLTKEQLYANAKLWLNENYKSSKAMQVDDKATGKLEVKGIMLVNKSAESNTKAGGVHYLLTIQLKEGRYKYVVTEFSHKDYTSTSGSGGNLNLKEPLCGYKNLSEKIWTSIQSQVLSETTQLIERLKTAMQTVAVEKKEDW